jgi:hypothetical protein
MIYDWRYISKACHYFSSVYLPMERIISSHMTGGNVDGVVMLGSPTTSAGFFGNCVKLDGLSAINFGWARNGCFLSPNLCANGFSLSMWIYNPGTKSGYSYYISSGGQTGTSYGFAITKQPTRHLALVKTKSHYYQCEFQMANQKWTHVAVTWYDDPANPVDSLHVYVDGISVTTPATVSVSVFSGTSAYNLITLGSPNNVNNTQYFGQASFDEFLFWDEWKSAAFISYVFDYWTGE